MDNRWAGWERGSANRSTLREFRDERRSRQRAYLACIAVFHVKDHLRKAGEKGVEPTMRGACGAAFDVVRGICNGTKHVETDGSHVISFRAGGIPTGRRRRWVN